MVNFKSNIKTLIKLLPFFGLVALLLVSPCKVRNFIETELNLPQTEVSNKSKVTLSTSNCSSFNVAFISASKKKVELKDVPSNAIISTDVAFNTYKLDKASVYSYKEREQAISAIPLYILHQNFKVYL